MYVGVIRGDMPGPIFMSDLEPTSQTNFTTEPYGQSRYVSRPSVANLTNYMAGLAPDGLVIPGSSGVPAGIEGASAVTFPLTLTGGNNVVRVKNTLAGSFVAVTISTGVYATMTALLVAVNAALSAASAGVSATTDTATGTLVVLQSTIPGVGSYVAVDTTVSGSTFNTPANLAAGGTSFTMPTATTIITALLPVGGPLNVSAANILTTLGASPAAAGVVSLIAPQFVETIAAIQSFQVGVMSKFLESTYNPDPTLLPPMASGPAITVVQNDGTTPFSAPLPIITGAVHNSPNPGDITITGTDMGNSEFYQGTIVRVTGTPSSNGSGSPSVRLTQKQINATLSGGTQGSVSATSIVIPASLLTTVTGAVLGVVGSTVEIEYTTLANTNYGTAATVSAASGGFATLTGLTNMNSGMVGGKITLSGAASAGNNGTFFIATFVSATSVTISNLYAVAPDANNGAIIWSQPAPIAFVVT